MALQDVNDFRKRNSRSLNEGIFAKWSPKMAYLLGQFKAGANFSINKKSSAQPIGYFYGITISSTNLQHLIKLQLLISSNHRIEYNLEPTKKYKQGMVQYILNIRNELMRSDLRRHGFVESEDATHKTNAPFPKDIPKAFIPHYIRGYFDERCSPGLQKPPYPFISISGTKLFLEELSDVICNETGMSARPLPKLNKSKNMKSFFIRYYGYEQVGILYDYLYCSSKIPSSLYCIERYNRFCTILKRKENYANIDVMLDAETLYVLHEICCQKKIDPNEIIERDMGNFLKFCKSKNVLPGSTEELISQGKQVSLKLGFGDDNTAWAEVFKNLIDQLASS